MEYRDEDKCILTRETPLITITNLIELNKYIIEMAKMIKTKYPAEYYNYFDSIPPDKIVFNIANINVIFSIILSATWLFSPRLLYKYYYSKNGIYKLLKDSANVSQFKDKLTYGHSYYILPLFGSKSQIDD